MASLPRKRPRTIRVLSWNVAKRRDCRAQVEALLALKPDIVVLQELNGRTWPRHRESLVAAGLTEATSAVELAAVGRSSDRSLPCFVAVASRWRLVASDPAPVPAAEAVACLSVNSPAGTFDLVGVHIPTYGRADRVLKVETQEGLIERLAGLSMPTLLCGDFNSPFAEERDGMVIPFARRRAERQHMAEAALMGLTNSSGLVDLFRKRHGYSVDAYSWYWKNRGKTGGYRLDHIFASRQFTVRACDYVHEWRSEGLSDHSAIYADVTLSEGR